VNHQAATLAQQFHSEIVLLHVVTALSDAASVPGDTREQADWDLVATIIRQAQKQQDPSLGPELAGLTIQRRLGTVDTSVATMQTAQDQKADLIMMPSHSYTFYQFHGPQPNTSAPIPILLDLSLAIGMRILPDQNQSLLKY
jgi:apolipoprotein N-acyltransferase